MRLPGSSSGPSVTPVTVRAVLSRAVEHDRRADGQGDAGEGEQRRPGDRLAALQRRRGLPGPRHAEEGDPKPRTNA